jgi:hypothetical protein
MQDSCATKDTQPKKKRCRKVFKTSAELELCADEHDTTSISEFDDEEPQAQTQKKKNKPSKALPETRDLLPTAKNLISAFEDIALVSSPDLESNVPVRDAENEIKYAPLALVWAPIRQKRIITMWPGQVMDSACVTNMEVPGWPPLLAGNEGNILVHYFGKNKFGWHEKSQLKLFCEIDAENAKEGRAKIFQKAVNKAMKALKKNGDTISRRILASPDAVELEAIDINNNVKRLKKARGGTFAPKIQIQPCIIASESFVPLEKQKNPRHVQVNCLTTTTASGLQKKLKGMKSVKSFRAKIQRTSKTNKVNHVEAPDTFVVSCIVFFSRHFFHSSNKQNCMCQAVLERLKSTVHKYEAGDGYKPISVIQH